MSTLELLALLGVWAAGGAGIGAFLTALPWPDAVKRRKPIGCNTCMAGWGVIHAGACAAAAVVDTCGDLSGVALILGLYLAVPVVFGALARSNIYGIGLAPLVAIWVLFDHASTVSIPAPDVVAFFTAGFFPAWGLAAVLMPLSPAGSMDSTVISR